MEPKQRFVPTYKSTIDYKSKLAGLQTSVREFIEKVDRIFTEPITFARGKQVTENVTVLEKALEESKK